jgi:hypothetical protein
MDDSNIPDNKMQPGTRVDLTELLALTGGDRVLVVKYVGIFISLAPVELNKLQQALNGNDGNLLYSCLHTLMSQVELMGIKTVLSELRLTEATLRQNKDITQTVRKSTDFIFNEITLACCELKNIHTTFI